MKPHIFVFFIHIYFHLKFEANTMPVQELISHIILKKSASSEKDAKAKTLFYLHTSEIVIVDYS